jgi:hypothetical protein
MHELRTTDKQQGRKQAWHGLTQVVPELSLSHPAFYLNEWDVEQGSVAVRKKDGKMLKLTTDDGKLADWGVLYVEPNPEHVEAVANGAAPVEGSGLITQPLFVSTPFAVDTYTPLPNKDFVRIIRASLEGLGISDAIESCGSVFDRRRVFVSIELPDFREFEAGGRVFKNYLNFLNSFDMSCHFMANTSNICVVCNNTFTANLQAGGCMIKHTKNMEDRLKDLPNVIAEANIRQKGFENDFLTLAGIECTATKAEHFFAGFLVKQGGLSTRAANTVESLMKLFGDAKQGNKGKDFADVFSAVTDYYTHESAGGESVAKQFQSSEFGDGANKKREAMSVLIKDDARKETMEIGERALVEYRAK